MARFQREAQVLASLNHPHIAQIYGIEQGDHKRTALVLEFVDGATLADRIEQGPLPLDETLADCGGRLLRRSRPRTTTASSIAT